MQCRVEEKAIRSMRVVVVKYFKYGEEGHKCRKCPLWQKQVRVACLVEGKAHQEWKRSSMEELRKKAEEHYGKGVPEEAQLLELEWYTLEIIVTYNECRGCGRKGSYAEDNRGQGVLQDRMF